MSVIESKMYALAILGFLTTVISAFYYLRIIKIIYFDKPKSALDENKDLGLKLSLFVSCILVIFYFINPSALTDLISFININ